MRRPRITVPSIPPFDIERLPTRWKLYFESETYRFARLKYLKKSSDVVYVIAAVEGYRRIFQKTRWAGPSFNPRRKYTYIYNGRRSVPPLEGNEETVYKENREPVFLVRPGPTHSAVLHAGGVTSTASDAAPSTGLLPTRPPES